MKYGTGSRIDLLLEKESGERCYVEVKNTTLAEGDRALFPDAVTTRGKKHLLELAEVVAQGHRGVMLFCVSRGDVARFSPADEIDPDYSATLREVAAKGSSSWPTRRWSPHELRSEDEPPDRALSPAREHERWPRRRLGGADGGAPQRRSRPAQTVTRYPSSATGYYWPPGPPMV